MNDIERDKETFRKSRAWQNFRKAKYTESSKDYITHKRLKSSYKLHHLDLNPDHYQDISNICHFENLNNDTHSIVHDLYKYYKKDPSVLDRLKDILDRMVEINRNR